MTKHYFISVREAADWNNIPRTNEPVTITDAIRDANFYNCKLWLQTGDGEYLGTVFPGRLGVVWKLDVSIDWRRIEGYWWGDENDFYAHSLMKLASVSNRLES